MLSPSPPAWKAASESVNQTHTRKKANTTVALWGPVFMAQPLPWVAVLQAEMRNGQ